jgi:hypothetical protein
MHENQHWSNDKINVIRVRGRKFKIRIEEVFLWTFKCLII